MALRALRVVLEARSPNVVAVEGIGVVVGSIVVAVGWSGRMGWHERKQTLEVMETTW